MQNDAVLLIAIDDDLRHLELIEEALRQPGLEILIETDPQKGLELVLARRPQIVLTDLMMPRHGRHGGSGKNHRGGSDRKSVV